MIVAKDKNQWFPGGAVSTVPTSTFSKFLSKYTIGIMGSCFRNKSQFTYEAKNGPETGIMPLQYIIE